jgi:4-hydroxy-4-methyl-2-oxoglutarate aldolase
MTDSHIVRMSRLDACVLSDALAAEGVPGTLSGLGPVAGTRSFTGRAITVDLEPASESAPESARHLATAALDSAGPGHVIVVAHHGITAVAAWGGILSQGAMRAGVEGVVVDGAVRDVDETRDLGLPVHAATVTLRSARGTVVERGWGCDVDIQGVMVTPGDLVRADGSGVAIVPAKLADKILAVAERLAGKESAMAAAVRAGVPMSEVMGAAYERSVKARPPRHGRTE